MPRNRISRHAPRRHSESPKIKGQSRLFDDIRTYRPLLEIGGVDANEYMHGVAENIGAKDRVVRHPLLELLPPGARRELIRKIPEPKKLRSKLGQFRDEHLSQSLELHAGGVILGDPTESAGARYINIVLDAVSSQRIRDEHAQILGHFGIGRISYLYCNLGVAVAEDPVANEFFQELKREVSPSMAVTLGGAVFFHEK
ncbi:MAG TPA: hypothetical protein VL989_00570 [Candidatus Sulfotelmatobacter sp.]|nr:hypothetical protein [Candidatus Sulfotelmatobacter sp.]